MFGWAVTTFAAAALCVAAGLGMDATELCREWEEQMGRAGVREEASWASAAESAVAAARSALPAAVRGQGYARLAAGRLSAWAPVGLVLAPLWVWALARGLDRRAAVPSPSLAYLAKRGVLLAVLLWTTAIFAPLPVPLWFAFVPASSLVACTRVYVSNLPAHL
jgi:hypothetical protein